MKSEKFRLQALGLLIGYALQFLAGMVLNLFWKTPSTKLLCQESNYFSRSFHNLIWILKDKGGWELSFHVYLGILLVVGSLSLLVKAMVAHNQKWIISGGIASLLTVAAFFNGLSFIDFSKNISSMIMAVCWLGAVCALLVIVIKTSKK
jgi:hypothetical protein